MSAIDPRPELNKILRLCKRCDLPEKAEAWATTTLDAIEPVMQFVTFLQFQGYPIPDDVLEEGFKKVHLIAQCWIAHEAEAEAWFRWRMDNGME